MKRIRKCSVTIKDEQHTALFHCWACRQFVTSGILVGTTAGQYSYTYAIVELQDGTVKCVSPEDVRFLDTDELFRDYYCGKSDFTMESKSGDVE